MYTKIFVVTTVSSWFRSLYHDSLDFLLHKKLYTLIKKIAKKLFFRVMLPNIFLMLKSTFWFRIWKRDIPCHGFKSVKCKMVPMDESNRCANMSISFSQSLMFNYPKITLVCSCIRFSWFFIKTFQKVPIFFSSEGRVKAGPQKPEFFIKHFTGKAVFVAWVRPPLHAIGKLILYLRIHFGSYEHQNKSFEAVL